MLIRGWIASFLIFCLPALFLLPGCNKTEKASIPDTDSLFIQYENRLLSSDTTLEASIDTMLASGKGLSPHQRARLYIIKASLLSGLNRDFRASNIYCDSALKLIRPNRKEPGNQKLYSDIFFLRGDNAFFLKRYRDAYYYYLIGKREGQLQHNKCVEANYDYRIAMALYRQRNYADALRFFYYSLDQLATCDKQFAKMYRRQQLLGNIGLCHVLLDHYDSAFISFHNTLAYIDTLKKSSPDYPILFEIAEGVAKGNLAKCYYARGDYRTALQLLDENIRINSDPHKDPGDALTSIVLKAEIFLKEKNLAGLERTIEAGNRLLPYVRDFGYLKKFANIQWRFYKLKNDKGKALEYAEKFIALNDSLYEAEKDMMNVDVESSIDRLEKENTVIELKAQSQKKQFILIFITSFLVTFIIISAFLINLVRNSRKQNRTLNLLNEQVSEQNKELKKLNTEKDKIMAVVAHDLRSPITSVYAINNIILESNPGLKAADTDALKMVNAACKNSLDLIEELLFFSSIGRKGNMLNPQKVHLNGFLKSIVGLLQFRAAEKKQQLIFHPAETDHELTIDTGKMARAIGNIITNAIKFSHDGTKVYIDITTADGYVMIRVADEGIGIPENMMAKIFDSFTDARRRGTAGESPFGLGLSISKQIIELHHGTLKVESIQGNGSTFYISLPL